MRALVIGGTRGFGKQISRNLSINGYEVITIGRSDGADYKCDVSNAGNLADTLEQVRSENLQLDMLACIVGFAKATPESELTPEFKNFVRRSNLGYVKKSCEELMENLSRSKEPRIITMGTLWSYRSKCKELSPYIESKRDLSEFTRAYSKANPDIKMNMYCVPTMNTPGYRRVYDSFRKLGMDAELEGLPKADSEMVAKMLVESAISTNGSGETFAIDMKGELTKLTKSR